MASYSVPHMSFVCSLASREPLDVINDFINKVVALVPPLSEL